MSFSISSSPQASHLRTVDSFDLESNDELGIHGNKSSFKLDNPNKSSLLTPAVLRPDKNMNGLFCM